MGKFSGLAARWRGFWRRNYGAWFCRRTIPYFVLAGLVLFYFGATLVQRGQRANSVPSIEQPIEAKAEKARSALRLGLDDKEFAAAWRAALAEQTTLAATAAPATESFGPARFVYPCRGTVISGRGWRKDELGIWTYHPGVDVKIDGEQPVLALGPGKVLRVEAGGAGGMLVELEHTGGWRSVYSRLERVTLKPDDHAAAGEIVGWPMHGQVRLEIWLDHTPQDPLVLLPDLGTPATR